MAKINDALHKYNRTKKARRERRAEAPVARAGAEVEVEYPDNFQSESESD